MLKRNNNNDPIIRDNGVDAAKFVIKVLVGIFHTLDLA